MNDLREVTKEPEFLTRHGYIRRDEETTDSVRSVWYEKSFDSDYSQLRLIIQIEFELAIYDGHGSYRDNLDYSFNGVYLRVYDRQMERMGNHPYDEDTENPKEIDRYKLNIHTLSSLRALAKIFGR
jgi:hypothetical protein